MATGSHQNANNWKTPKSLWVHRGIRGATKALPVNDYFPDRRWRRHDLHSAVIQSTRTNRLCGDRTKQGAKTKHHRRACYRCQLLVTCLRIKPGVCRPFQHINSVRRKDNSPRSSRQRSFQAPLLECTRQWWPTLRSTFSISSTSNIRSAYSQQLQLQQPQPQLVSTRSGSYPRPRPTSNLEVMPVSRVGWPACIVPTPSHPWNRIPKLSSTWANSPSNYHAGVFSPEFHLRQEIFKNFNDTPTGVLCPCPADQGHP